MEDGPTHVPSSRRRRSSQIAPLNTLPEESSLMEAICSALPSGFNTPGDVSLISANSPQLQGRDCGKYLVHNDTLDIDIDALSDSQLLEHYEDVGDSDDEEADGTDAGNNSILPKRLSTALTEELSKDFLEYLNLKADLEESSNLKDSDNCSFAASDEYEAVDDEVDLSDMIDRERIRRLSSIRKNPEAYYKHISLPLLRTMSASSKTTTFGSIPSSDPDSAADMNSYFKVRRELRMYRKKLAEQCEANFRLEKNLRMLDECIGLLIHHRITIEDIDPKLLNYDFKLYSGKLISEKKSHAYGQLFFVLQNHPEHIANLARQLSLSEIDDFLQTIMFTLFGNFEVREEHLLLTMFEHALGLEFAHAKDMGSVMRNNSAISRMMTTYTRRGLGQQYLKDVLMPQIELIYELNTLSLEIDPVKIYQELAREGVVQGTCMDAAEALQDPEVRTVAEERARALKELSTRFLNAIIDGLANIPYGVRWLCKSIRQQSMKAFPAALTEPVVSLIGGFFLLRYINPAIISPEAFGIVHKKPSAIIRRNLTQIAKILQAVANNATLAKSPAIAVLGNFIQQQKERLHQFLLSVCEVEDFYTDYHLEKISALAKLETTISITPNEIYSVHTLLLKYRSQLQLSEEILLGRILKEVGEEPPAKLSREHNILMELKLTAPYRPAVRQDSRSSLVIGDVTNDDEKITNRQLELLGSEKERTKAAFESSCENCAYLTERLEAYQEYLENVRGQSVSGSSMATEYVSFEPEHRRSFQTMKNNFSREMLPKGVGPFEFKLSKLDKEDVVLWCNPSCIPSLGDSSRSLYVVVFSMPTVGHVIFSIRIKGREPIFHTECKFEDILVKMEESRPAIKLGDFLELDAHRMLVLVDSTMFK